MLLNYFAFQEEDNILVVHKNAKQKESFEKRYKEVKTPIYCVTGFFLLAFLLQAVLPVITNKAT